MAGRLKHFARRLAADLSGIAMTEFAMSLPVLTALSITGVETAHYVTANMRVSQIALSVSDNAGRIRDSIDETDVDAIMIGARIAGQSIDFGQNGRVILSMVESNGLTGANAGQKMTWQRCFGAKNIASSYGEQGDGATNASHADGFGPADNRIVAPAGDGLMFVEVVYDYQPLFLVDSDLIAGLSNQTIRYTAAFPVRERDDNAIKNGFGLSNSQKRLCTTFSAT
jgi:Flp pilus assembly protein TadG